MNYTPWRYCVAPMMDWTDRHCRFFHRQLSRHARLYTEMVTTPALMHGDVPRHLAFDAREQPVALQLGGSETDELAHCAKLAQTYGYAEVNLNCGCPSERVQRGAFGACLMAEPLLVRDCVRAMVDAVSIPVTVKHRIGIDKTDDYAFVRDFVGTVAEGGAQVFIVHARSAWLKGLSPKENREIPPLRYNYAAQLKKDFPQLTIIVNGGLVEASDISTQLDVCDGVMIGRHAYHEPYSLALVDSTWFDEANVPPRDAVIDAMQAYAVTQMDEGVPVRAIARHMLGLFNGLPGARVWRRSLSDPALQKRYGAELFTQAREAMQQAAAATERLAA
jgi:tRNA-dihydrouridine synthase A